MKTTPFAAERTRSPAYLWFDAEFTGLDTASAKLLQVALVITDISLRRLTLPARDVNLCIRLDPDASVSDWVAKNHSCPPLYYRPAS